MKRRSSPPPIVFILLSLLLLGFALSLKPSISKLFSFPNGDNVMSGGLSNPEYKDPSNKDNSFKFYDEVPINIKVRIGGSTSMVEINKKLKEGFENKYRGTQVITNDNDNANGSETGIQDLIHGNIDVAALSCDLTNENKKKGLKAVLISNDAIAIIVHQTNPFKNGLTGTQIADIFQGKTITNWSQVGGSPDPIRVINRPKKSGTYECFKKLALKGGDFGDFMTVKDGSTELIRKLKNDGIGYTTYKQAAKENTARILAIDNSVPGASNYPYRRQLFYVYKNPPNEAVKYFLGYATSQQVKDTL